MKNRIQIVQENINRINNLLQLASKDDKYDPEALKKLRSDHFEYTKELARLRREEWEEIHERLDFGDDR